MPPSTDDLKSPEEISDGDLDVAHGGAWSLCLNDPSIRDLIPDGDTDLSGAEAPIEQPAAVSKSKLLHK